MKSFSFVQVKVRDIPDVINRTPRIRLFQSRLFLPENSGEEEAAVSELNDLLRREGFTPADVLCARKGRVEVSDAVQSAAAAKPPPNPKP